MKIVNSHNQIEKSIIVKTMFLSLTVIFLSADFLPNYLGDVKFNKIELTQSGDQESESNGKEIEQEDVKDYLFNYININKGRNLTELFAKTTDPTLFNRLYLDVFTPPPEQYAYSVC